jgi:hypothetical protein
MEDGDADAIEAHLARGDATAAYGVLCNVFAWPNGKRVGVAQFPRVVDLFARTAQAKGAEPLAELAREVVRDPDSPDKLYDLGYALIDAGAPNLAASILWRCLALVGESEEVVCELVSALESALAYADAFAVLDQFPALRARSFLCRYLHAFDAAMTGNLAVARAALPSLVPDSPDTEAMALTLAGIVERADRVGGATPLDATDLRGWHYVLTGTLVAHQSPHGFDEPMHGRYAFLQDSVQRCAFGIARLVPLVRAFGHGIPCIYPAPGRSSEILALAVARATQLPIAPWPAVGVPAPGLVVIYDLAELGTADIARLVPRRERQIVFAHATPWTVDSPVAADIATLLYQTLVPPWGEMMTVDSTTGAVTQGAGDPRPAGDIALDIAGAASLPDADLGADQPERWAALVERAWPPEPGTRSRSWGGGPVASSRFA